MAVTQYIRSIQPRWRVERRGRVFLALFSSMLLFSTAFADQVEEYDLKAALLVKVTAFVTWPSADAELRQSSAEEVSEARPAVESNGGASANATKDAPSAQEHLCIGIIGEDPFGPSFDSLLSRADTERRTMNVRRVASAQDAAGCQVIFLAPSVRPQASEIIAAVSGHVLTIADFSGFAAAGGMVEMALDGKRISLTINRSAVERAGLTISSKLLSLAHVIDDGGEAAANASP